MSILNNTYCMDDDDSILTTGCITANTGTLSINPYITTVSASPYITVSNNTSSLSVHGKSNFSNDVEIDGDLKVKGKSILDSLEKIEERLNIVHINEEIEKEWDELRELGEKYRQLEKEIQEKILVEKCLRG